MKIYKLLLTSGLLLLTAQSLFAQQGYQYNHSSSNIDSKQIRFGVFVAPTLSWMKPTTDKTSDGMYAPKNNGSKIGFTYGLMAEYQFADNYSFVTGLYKRQNEIAQN